MASSLLKLGVSKGDRVSTFLGNTGELVTTLFAAAKIGAVFNPVNCNLSPAELSYILNDAESKVLVFGQDERAKVERARSRLKTVHDYIFTGQGYPEYAIPYRQLIKESSKSRPGVRVLESDWYSIIYTSGTTGKHKGVIHRHRDIVDHSMCMIECQKLSYQDRGLSVAPLYHASELHCFFIPRVHIGAANVILKRFDPSRVLEMLEREEITFMFADPAKWNAILQHAPGRQSAGSLRLLANGGAPMPPALTRKCKEVFNTPIIHLYGATEMGPVISVLYPHEQETKAGSAGKPLINHEIRVVRLDSVYPSNPDDLMNTGDQGEIIVRGIGMMQGYYNRPEMTAEALYGGWYHTGDIGRLDEDGYLWLSDRRDDAIVSGDAIIYPREIEEVLLQHPDVRETAVIGIQGKECEAEIVAFIVSDNDHLTARELQHYLRVSDKLAHFKIPGVYKFIEQLPMVTTGKIQKRLLVEQFYKAKK